MYQSQREVRRKEASPSQAGKRAALVCSKAVAYTPYACSPKLDGALGALGDKRKLPTETANFSEVLQNTPICKTQSNPIWPPTEETGHTNQEYNLIKQGPFCLKPET